MDSDRDDRTALDDSRGEQREYDCVSRAEDEWMRHRQKQQSKGALAAVRHFRFVIVPESDLVSGWQEYTEREKSMLCAGVLKEVRGFTYRGLAEFLNHSPEVASAAGFDGTDDVPTYSVLSRAIGEFDDEMLTTAGEWARNAAQHKLVGSTKTNLDSDPGQPDFLAEYFPPKQRISTGEKMEVATQLVAEYMAIVKEQLTFGRDRDAPNFQYPIEELYRLLAHIALEDCYLENGYRVFNWKRGDGVRVPSPERIRHYANEHEVEALEEKFLKASCELLSRDRFHEHRWDRAHLAFDVTDVPWYGDENHVWTSSGKKMLNTTNYWKYAVLSVVTNRHDKAQQNYILGITPIKDGTEDTDALRRLLRRAADHSGLKFGRVYLDSGFYQGDAVKACRDVGASYVIQAHDRGAPGNLIDETPRGEHDYETDISFAGLSGDPAIHTFVSPIDEAEVGQSERDQTHTAWLTDLDVEERSLRGLAYQFRRRWEVETGIRQLKHDFRGRCQSEDRHVRTLYAGAAQLFFNFWVALRSDLKVRLSEIPRHRITGLETLHAIREADYDAVDEYSQQI